MVYVGHGHWEATVGRLFPVDMKFESHLLKAHRPYVTVDYSREPFLGMLVVGRCKEEEDAYSSSEVRLLKGVGEMVGNALRHQ